MDKVREKLGRWSQLSPCSWDLRPGSSSGALPHRGQEPQENQHPSQLAAHGGLFQHPTRPAVWKDSEIPSLTWRDPCEDYRLCVFLIVYGAKN